MWSLDGVNTVQDDVMMTVSGTKRGVTGRWEGKEEEKKAAAGMEELRRR